MTPAFCAVNRNTPAGCWDRLVGGGGSTAPVACRMHRRQHARRVAEAQRCRCALRASRCIMPGRRPLSQPAPQLAGQCCVPCRHVTREARTFDGRPTEPDTRCRVLLAATGHGSVSTASTAGHQLAADGARHASTATSATRLIVGTLDHRPGAASSHTADHACTSSVVNRLSFAADAAARRECWPGARGPDSEPHSRTRCRKRRREGSSQYTSGGRRPCAEKSQHPTAKLYRRRESEYGRVVGDMGAAAENSGTRLSAMYKQSEG